MKGALPPPITRPERDRGRLRERVFTAVCLGAVLLPLLLLLGSVAQLLLQGADRLSWAFLTGGTSGRAELTGILPAVIGTLELVGLTAAFSLPAGVGAGLYLEEYGGSGRLARAVETNLVHLAGVPSVIYGLVGLALFVRTLGLGHSLIAGALTLSVLVLPVVTLATREALRAVPAAQREAGTALGGTGWQVVRQVVLPEALPGILTGALRAMSRAVGETAPLLVVGALGHLASHPDPRQPPLPALPVQIFQWVFHPGPAFWAEAASAILVLLAILGLLEGGAALLRTRLPRR